MAVRPGASEPNSDDALVQISIRCQPLVARICHSRLSGLPAADIEDAVQETFLQLAQANYSEIVNVEAWLTFVALRMCAHTLRARYRSREISFLDSQQTVGSFDRAIEHTDEHLLLAKVTALLSTDDANLLHMLYIEDLPYGQIAQSLGVSSGHARVLAYRARQRARVVIEGLE